MERMMIYCLDCDRLMSGLDYLMHSADHTAVKVKVSFEVG